MNGGSCCLLKVCCPAVEDQREALANELNKHMKWTGREVEYGIDIASLLLDNFDLVPKGVGEKIVEAYRPLFAEAERSNK